MRIIFAFCAAVALVVLTGCSAPRASLASAGGTGDPYQVSTGHGSSSLAYPEGDYRNVLSDPLF